MIKKEIMKVLVLALASALAGVGVVAAFADRPLAEGRVSDDAPGGTIGASTEATARTAGARVGVDRQTRYAFGSERYLVKAGDTLWDIAARHYEDASTAMERIKRRNRLERDALLAGEVLVLPAAGRRSEGPRADEMCSAGDAATNAPPAP